MCIVIAFLSKLITDKKVLYLSFFLLEYLGRVMTFAEIFGLLSTSSMTNNDIDYLKIQKQ